jgi:hypothetical protein
LIYRYAPTVPFELSSFYPAPEKYDLPRRDLRFVVFLRDPVARAFSSYWFKSGWRFHNGIDTGSLSDFASSVDKEISDRAVYDVRLFRLQHLLAKIVRALNPSSSISLPGMYGQRIFYEILWDPFSFHEAKRI